MNECFVVDHSRSPRVRKNGKFLDIHPVDLLSFSLTNLARKINIDSSKVSDVYAGCVTQVKEQAWCIARAAILASNWDINVPGVTINRLCGSSLQAVNFACDSIRANSQIIFAGGVEHMTRAPMFSDAGGEDSPLIHKFHPELVNQGLAAELIAKKYNISRMDCDLFSLNSHKKATNAIAKNYFSKSIFEVNGVTTDDNPRADSTIEKLNSLKTVFREDGVITAGNASAIVDGSAMICLASQKCLSENNLKPRAKIVAHAAVGSDPLLMLTGIEPAIKKLLKMASLKISDIDLFEINEAFAPVVIHAAKQLDINPDLINISGGAIALGHPLGATGAIILGNLIDDLERTNKKYGIAAMCIGLGMGIATLVELT